MSKEKVLIVGGGFGGVKTALLLSDNGRFDITLLSDNDDMRYYPTLYHTATGGRRANSSIPLKHIFNGKDIKLVHRTATSLDRKNKLLSTKEGDSFEYDVAVFSMGVVTNYFGIPGLDEFSYSIKTETEIRRFKRHLHKQLSDDRKPDLHYVIVGAGPTGIELAGALPSYLKEIMKKHGVRDRRLHIDLIEALPRLLPRMPKRTSNAVKRRMRSLGIRLYLGKAVQGQSADELTVNGKPIRSHTVVWTAGVTNNPFFKNNDFVLNKRGKVAVDAYLQAEDDIFVIGDNANTPWSGMAQTALHDGELIAHNLIRKSKGKQFKSYRVKQPATIIPAGPRWAAVSWGKLQFNGKSGWLLREAADLFGFHYLEPWPRAAKQFLTEFSYDDDCPICTVANDN